MDEPGDLPRVEATLSATRAVGGVVNAIWALGRAQLPRAESAVAENAVYLAWLDRLVVELAGPALEERGERSLLVVLGPERSFCGDLADSVLRNARGAGPRALVGTRLVEVAARAQPEEESVFVLAGAAGVDDLPAASARLAEAVLRHAKTDAGEARVDLLYPGERRGEVGRAVLLATRRGSPSSGRDLYTPPIQVAEAALRESIAGHLQAALTRTLLAETRARVAAAERARRAIDERERDLLTLLRRMERERVTNELIELANATEGSRASR